MFHNFNAPLFVFSVVIPAYNEEKLITECIKSIRAQVGNFAYEIIVVNNNSSDRTAEIAANLGARVVSETRRGVGWARRTGTQAASGIFVTNLDADTHLPSNYLQKVYDHFQTDPNLVCVGGQMVYYDAPWWKNFLRIFIHYYLWLFARFSSNGTIGPMGNNMTFKKEIYNQTAGFDGNLKFGEDADLCRKLSKFGKVFLDMKLKCFVSARRYKFNKHLAIYFINFLRMCVGKSPIKNELPHPDEI